jgi:FMN phosphatase YigB (HAD superfamily)
MDANDRRSLALFDIDNTLFDRQRVFGLWARYFVNEQSLPLGAFDLLVELDDRGFAPREAVFGGLKQNFELGQSIDELISEYRAVNPGFIREDAKLRSRLLQLGRNGWTLGVITNGPPSQRTKLAKLGLEDVFDVIVISDEIGARKPDVEIFDHALSSLGGRRSFNEIWMIGDEPTTDILGGANFGLKTYWISHGRSWTLDEFRPDATGEGIDDVVRRLLGNP